MQDLQRKDIMMIMVILIVVVSGSGLLIWKNMTEGSSIQTNLAGMESSIETSARKVNDQQQKVYVHVTGGVNNPGVYTLSPGARIVDALEKAGGKTSEADIESINLAAEVEDGEKVHIPLRGENGKNNISTSDGRLNINKASRSELQELPGIGPARANNIIELREKLGGFIEIEQLLEVNGIGEKTLKELEKELIVR